MEIAQRNGNLVVTAELPGINKEDLKVEVVDGALVISGFRKYEKENKEEDYFRTERMYGEFYRTIPLPEEVKIEAIS